MVQIKQYLLVEESMFFPKDTKYEVDTIDGLIFGYIVDILQKHPALMLKINIGDSRVSDTRRMILSNIFISLRICPIFNSSDNPIKIGNDIILHLLRVNDPKVSTVKNTIADRLNNENISGYYDGFFFRFSNRSYSSKMGEIEKVLSTYK